MLLQLFSFATNLLLYALEGYKVFFAGFGWVSPPAHFLSFPALGDGFCEFATIPATKIIALMVNNNGNEYPYRLCEIKDRKGDLSKRWYVEFYVWDLSLSKLVRPAPIYISSSQFKTASERYAQGRYIKKVIDKELVKGKVLGSSKKPAKLKKPKPSISLDTDIRTAIEYGRDAKQVGNSLRTKQAYNTISGRLIEFFESKGINKLSEVTTTSIFEFVDWLVEKYKLKNKTRNNYLENVTSLFKVLKDRKIIKKNPCRKLRKLRESKSKHTAYSDADGKVIKDFLRENDPQLYLFCSFIYYGFIRPKELRFLQVKHIGADKILIPDRIAFGGVDIPVSKNRESEYVVIPNGLNELIEEFELRKYPPDHFLFTTNQRPGEKFTSYNYFNKRYREILNLLEMQMDYTAYAWKHTGVIKLYMEIKDIRKVQLQCRHKKMETTVEYLRDLGLFDNKEVEMQFPTF